MDILPSVGIFRELQDIHDTGYFSAQPSLDDHWQQVIYCREHVWPRPYPLKNRCCQQLTEDKRQTSKRRLFSTSGTCVPPLHDAPKTQPRHRCYTMQKTGLKIRGSWQTETSECDTLWERARRTDVWKTREHKTGESYNTRSHGTSCVCVCEWVNQS